MFCASCGSEYDARAQFCPGCGQRITGRRQVAPVAEPVAAGTATRPVVARERRPIQPPRTVTRDDVESTLQARHELGDRMEPEVVDAFLDRVESGIDARIDQRVNERMRGIRGLRGRKGQESIVRIAISLGAGIPLTAIAGELGQEFGIAAVWLAITGLNVYYTESEKRE